MRIKTTILSLVLAATLFVTILSGCSTQGKPKNNENIDVVTTASLVNDEASFLKAVSKEGTWIIAILKDMTIDKDVVIEGEFTKDNAPARKLALYAQDENRKKTASYTLKAPKLIVRSESTKMQGGTFVGDVYVEANNFLVADAKVEGNVYFSKEEFKKTFKLEDGGSVTGVTEVK